MKIKRVKRQLQAKETTFRATGVRYSDLYWSKRDELLSPTKVDVLQSKIDPIFKKYGHTVERVKLNDE